jgi:hypothetical protein
MMRLAMLIIVVCAVGHYSRIECDQWPFLIQFMCEE